MDWEELKSKLEDCLPKDEGYHWINDIDPYYIRPFDKDASREWWYGVYVVNSDEIYAATVTPDIRRIWGDPYDRKCSINRFYTITELDTAIDIARRHTEACINDHSLLNNYQ